MIRKIGQIRDEIMLFLRSPKEYLYLYTYPKDRYVKIEAYNAEVRKVGEDLIKKIHRRYPLLKIHFLGSTALKIAGQKDIDLFIECDKDEIFKVLPLFEKWFGPPTKKKSDMIEWSFVKDDCSIQMILIDPKNPLLAKHLNTFKVLKKKKVLKEYKKFKSGLGGLNEREYARRKLEFFVKYGL